MGLQLIPVRKSLERQYKGTNTKFGAEGSMKMRQEMTTNYKFQKLKKGHTAAASRKKKALSLQFWAAFSLMTTTSDGNFVISLSTGRTESSFGLSSSSIDRFPFDSWGALETSHMGGLTVYRFAVKAQAF